MTCPVFLAAPSVASSVLSAAFAVAWPVFFAAFLVAWPVSLAASFTSVAASWAYANAARASTTRESFSFIDPPDLNLGWVEYEGGLRRAQATSSSLVQRFAFQRSQSLVIHFP